MLRSSLGEKLYRRVEVRINFPPDILPSRKLIYKSGPRQGYSPDGLDQILMHTADQLDQLYPWWDFQMVPLAPRGRVASYVFNCTGTRPMANPASQQNVNPEAVLTEAKVEPKADV